MKIQFDDCTDLDSLLHQWDARFKVIGLVSLMMAFATVKSLSLIPWMVLMVGILYRLSCLPLSFLRARLRYPGLFLVGIILFIPWLSGQTPLWQWGPLTLWEEGILLSALITGRFLCSVTLGFIVLGTTPFLKLVKALRSLGVPTVLTDMMLLSYRYVFEILANLDRMRRAMVLRGFRIMPTHQKLRRRSPQSLSALESRESTQTRSLTHQIPILATLAGTLFIRSYEQAERVYQAMRLRGYGYGVGARGGAAPRSALVAPLGRQRQRLSAHDEVQNPKSKIQNSENPPPSPLPRGGIGVLERPNTPTPQRPNASTPQPPNALPKSKIQNLKSKIPCFIYFWDAIALFTMVCMAIGLFVANYWLA